MSPVKHHHTITPLCTLLYGGKYTCGDHPFTYSASLKDTKVGTKNLQFGLQTKGQISTGLMSIARVSWPKQFFLLMSISIGFLAMKAGFMQSPLNSWCVCYLNSEAFIWAAISEAGNSNELILCSRGNSGSYFPVAVLTRANFIIAQLVFATALEETFKVLEMFHIDWPSCLKIMMDCQIHNMDLVFYQIGPCHNTTDWLKHQFRRKKGSTN